MALVIIYFLLFAIMFSSIVFFENSSKKIILWGLIVSFTSIVGYIVYFIFSATKVVWRNFYILKKKKIVFIKL